MSYLFSDFTPEDRVSLLELEIARLQELCRKNFATIDEMKKESKKLNEVHTELKETTSDLAYSLAECPWWETESLQSAVKILASFTQKIQYILELPTFIDPIEQLERNGGFDNSTITKILKRRSGGPESSQSSTTLKLHPFVRTCKKCKKKFQSLSNYEKHSQIHGRSSKRVKCRFCPEASFHSFTGYKFHLKNIHSFPPIHNNNNPNQDEGENMLNGQNEKQNLSMSISAAEKLKKNHVRVWRFIKCELCDTVCSLNSSFKKHLRICRALQQEQQQSSSSDSSSKTEVAPDILLVPSSDNLNSENTSSLNFSKKSSSLPYTNSKSSFQNIMCKKTSAMTATTTPKIVTLHEDTSETAVDFQDEEDIVLNLTKDMRVNLDACTSKDTNTMVNDSQLPAVTNNIIKSSNHQPQPIEEEFTSSSSRNNGAELIGGSSGVVADHTELTNQMEVEDKNELMTVAGDPVRLSSMHAFSINVNSSTSTSTASSTSASTSTSQVALSKDVNMSKITDKNPISTGGSKNHVVEQTPQQKLQQQQSLNLSHSNYNNCNTLPITSTATTAPPILLPSFSDGVSTTVSRAGQSGNILLSSALSLPHSSVSSKLSPTMCFLPSSSSSWESGKEEPEEEEEQDPGQPSTSNSQTSNNKNSIMNGNRGATANKFTCSHRNCSRSFGTKSKLFHHEKTHTEFGASRSFACQLCSKEFKDKYRLKTHFLSHCSESFLQKPMYRCLECGVLHGSLKDLARHNEVEHSNSKMNQPRFSCDCGFFTNFRCKLDLHKKSNNQCRNRAGAGTSGRNISSSNDNHRVGFTVFRDSNAAL